MQSQKFTINDLKKEETGWKELILLNELTLLQRFSQSGLHKAYTEAESNAWIVKTLVDKKQRYKFETCKSIVLVGSGTRDTITQSDSLAIWNIYKKYLPSKVKIMASPDNKPPIGAIFLMLGKTPMKLFTFL